MNSDYYELLGVDADAPVDDIRAAYRDKRSAVADAGTDDAKADAAALNKAWNVLSDPYQRGRYDQKRASGAEDGDDDSEDDADAAVPARRAAKTNPRTNSRGRPLPEPTVKLPAGVVFPANKRRGIAVAVDLAMLIVLFIGSQLLVVSLEKSNHRAVYDQVVNVLPKQINTAHDKSSAAKKKQSADNKTLTDLKAKKGVDSATLQTARAAVDSDKSAVDAAQKAEDALNKKLTDGQSVLAPTSRLISGLFFVAALVLLLGASLVLGGATIGKRYQKIRVARLDGSPARATDLFRRYVLLVFAAYAAFNLLGPPGALIVVFVSTLWTRNPNRQGLHDRFAKTLVVSDAAE